MNRHTLRRAPRLDLGPRFRQLLDQQPGRRYAIPDITQQEARYGGIRPSIRETFTGGYNLRRPFGTEPVFTGGTRKIAELPEVCRNPEHNPATMRVYTPGVYEHTCPGCGAVQHFTVCGAMF